MRKIFKKINNEKGLGFVELVVAVSIFSMVVIAASGIFINVIKAQRAIIFKQGVTDNLRYAMEYMAKELRMAQKDSANPDLTFNNGDGSSVKNAIATKIFFKNGFDETIIYEFDSVNQKILRNDLSGGDGSQPISSDEILITSLNFFINNWSFTSGGGAAPLITIFIKGKAKNGAGNEIEMQTSVSPRIYN